MVKGRMAETVKVRIEEGRMSRKIKKGLQMRGKRMAE